jgi:peptidoglycan hydrolase-like protein with peptidoglycan-binding domain
MNPIPPTLRLGATGPFVVQLQQRLPPEFTIAADGVFGSQTEQGVRSVQRVAFLEDDGIVGPQTWAVLGIGTPVTKPTLRIGDRGPYVRRIQRLLNFQDTISPEVFGHPGYYVGPINGQFDTPTQNAVKAFQADQSPPLQADGIIGSRTWQALTRMMQILVHYPL